MDQESVWTKGKSAIELTLRWNPKKEQQQNLSSASL